MKAAEAGVAHAKAQEKQANDTLHRLEPLLPKGFATAEQVDQATTASRVAAQGLAAAEQKLNQAKDGTQHIANIARATTGRGRGSEVCRARTFLLQS